MNKKKMTVLAVTAALILILAIFISFYRTYIQGIDDPILLPDDPGPSHDAVIVSNAPASPSPTPPITKIEVTAGNVQTVLSTLARPTAYYMRINIETIWDGGNGFETRQIWVKDGYSKIELLSPAGYVREHTIICPEKAYIWLQGTALPYEGSIGDFNADIKLRIPTYEKVLSVEPSEIDSADYILLDNIPCAYVRLKPNKLSYVEEFWISIDSGLLIRAETSKNGKSTYKMFTETFSTDTPSDDRFTLPNGRLVFTTQ